MFVYVSVLTVVTVYILGVVCASQETDKENCLEMTSNVSSTMLNSTQARSSKPREIQYSLEVHNMFSLVIKAAFH